MASCFLNRYEDSNGVEIWVDDLQLAELLVRDWTEHVEKAREELAIIKADSNSSEWSRDWHERDLERCERQLAEAEKDFDTEWQKVENEAYEEEHWDEIQAEKARPDYPRSWFPTEDWVNYARLLETAEQPELLNTLRLEDAARRTAPSLSEDVWNDQLDGFQDERLWQGWTPEELHTAVALAVFNLDREIRYKHFGKWSVDRDEVADFAEAEALVTLERWYRAVYAVYASEGLDWTPEVFWKHTDLA